MNRFPDYLEECDVYGLAYGKRGSVCAARCYLLNGILCSLINGLYSNRERNREQQSDGYKVNSVLLPQAVLI